MDPSPDIQAAKDAFNRFFRDDLYGRFDAPDNLILSRGAWKDEVVRLPAFFRFCLDLSLRKHWVGYSDPLGHERTFTALVEWAGLDQAVPYSVRNCALTLGNVATAGLVFDQLREELPDARVLTLAPYYPPLLQAVARAFPVGTVSSLLPEPEVLSRLEDACRRDRGFRVLFLSNFIGVEGRIFSRAFWDHVLGLCEELGLWLVIDEGLWFERLAYPERMNNERTIRLVSTSKKYGNPGMKVGYLLAPERFLRGYYDRVSCYLGGPPSLLFLLAEFLYKFETVAHGGDAGPLAELSRRYGIDEARVARLFEDAQATLAHNRRTYQANRRLLEDWVAGNGDILRGAHLYEGINFLIEPRTELPAYDLFTNLVQEKKVSVFPGRCLGDGSDRLCRLTILESPAEVREGLARLADFLRER